METLKEKTSKELQIQKNVVLLHLINSNNNNYKYDYRLYCWGL